MGNKTEWYTPATNEADCLDHAIKLSLDNPGMYVSVFVDFGCAGFNISRSLNVFAPSSSTYTWYVLNGKQRHFTEAQRIADQNATPMML